MSKNKTVNEICILGYSNVFKMSFFYSFELCGSVPLKNKRKNSASHRPRKTDFIHHNSETTKDTLLTTTK